MAVRLEPHDEYTHEVGPESNFNESMYFNVFDPADHLGGFFRLGNRPNEGRGEMTVCVYLPDGRVGFMFQRPEVTSNTAFDSAGMRFRCVEPFEHLEVSYRGRVVVLDDPLQMADPRQAFAENPYEPCEVELTYTRVSDMFGGEPEESRERPGEEFARAHYEQLVRGRGSIRVGEHEWAVDGFGLRDHSWGPRSWQAPWYYRWLTANFGEDFGFMGSRVARRDGDGHRGGFVWDGEQLRICRRFEISTGWEGDERHHRTVSATLGTDEREWRITGRVLNLIPLRNRREDPETGETLLTRISEGMTEWTLEDGRVGHGLSEYLDQIVDGEPVGIGE